MIKIKNLSKTFKSGEIQVKAVNNLTIQIPDGIFCAIIGKSGSGKSTLLSLMGALDRPSSGLIEVNGHDIGKMPDSKLIAYRRDTIGFVFQGYNLVPNLSARENVVLPMEFAGIPREERIQRAQGLLKEVGITQEKFSRMQARLSGGEQQRVAIARALANKPSLILADEPTGNLDSATGKVIVDLLKDLAKKEKTTIIAVTHDQSIARSSELTFKLQDGKLV
ncbi:MAG: ABC transporter ATP-binding protein [Candidatus Berkelbacteria bacterium]|nr:ABC transporter ATP-binding protein [Candidatus Berkelbacteria bacterium]